MKQLILTTFLATLFFLSGCTQQPKPTKEPQIDQSLPKVSVNGHIESMNGIAFEWVPSTDIRVKGYYIYRSTPNSKDNKLSRHAIVENRFASHYTDSDLTPNTTYTYKFSTYNQKAQESVASKTYMVTTNPLLSSVSFFDSIGNLPRMAKLIWRPHDSADVKAYIIERQTVEKPDWHEIAIINNRLHAEYIDKDLDDNRVYKYRLRALTYDDIRSTPSEVVKVITKPLPNEIQNLQATTGLPKKIKLSWDPSTEKDHAYYNIYRSASGAVPFDYYVKLNETSFTDVIKEDGKYYYYKVTSTDIDGLEGLRQSVPTHGNTLEKPKTPTLLNAFVKNGSAVLTWKSNDPRTKTFTVVKKTKTSWINWTSQEITGITQNSYTVKDLKPDTEYKFEIIAIDGKNISSEPTKAAEILFSTPNR